MQDILARPAAPPVAAALFNDPACLHDAVADLREAGFEDIAIAFSLEATREPQKDLKAQHARQEAVHGEKHTLPWRVRHGIEEDIHRKGAEILAGQGKDGTISGSPYREVDLQETLQGMGVAQYRIDLISREIGIGGSLLLVQAGERSEEAQAILEQNCGINRTDTATERAPAGTQVLSKADFAPKSVT